MQEYILEVKNLVKDFGGFKAVNALSFAIKKGICFGLLGPNGAGKTTTIEMIEGLLTPTAGSILYKGKPRDKSFKEEVGIQLQSTELMQFLTVKETLETFHHLYTRQAKLEDIIQICQLEEILERDNRKISGGQRQRLLLGLALVNQPELIFLDEPTTGMDPQARRHLWDIAQTIKKEHKTIVLTTHYMDEAEILCDIIAIMDKGKIIEMGSPRKLLNKHCPHTAVIFSQEIEAEKLKTLPWEILEIKGKYEIQVDDVNQCLQILMEKDFDLSNITIRSQNLEDLFIKLTGRTLRE